MGILPEKQSGIRPNRSATDMMAVIHRLQELARKKQIPLYVLFINLTRAYDGMRACVRLDDRVWSGMFAVEQGLRQGCVLAPLLFNIFFAAVINVAYTCFNVDKDIMDALVHLRKKKGAGGRGGGGEATAREPVLATLLWGMLYADDAGIVSQSPTQLRKMMGVIVVVCAAFGLTVSEAKIEIICLRTKGMPESTATFKVEAASQVYNQTNDFVYLGGNVNHKAGLSIEVDQCIRNAWCGLRKYTLEQYDRPSTPLELKICMVRAEVLETMLYTLIKMGSESIEATLRRRWIFFAGFVARMEDTRLPKCVMFGELVGGAGCVGSQEKVGTGCFLDNSEPSTSTPTSGRLQPRRRGK